MDYTEVIQILEARREALMDELTKIDAALQALGVEVQTPCTRLGALTPRSFGRKAKIVAGLFKATFDSIPTDGTPVSLDTVVDAVQAQFKVPIVRANVVSALFALRKHHRLIERPERGWYRRTQPSPDES